jgi:hypothetical protein
MAYSNSSYRLSQLLQGQKSPCEIATNALTGDSKDRFGILGMRRLKIAPATNPVINFGVCTRRYANDLSH